MKIVIACDSFKESLTAEQACQSIKDGIKEVDDTIDCLCVPMADGGEGTTDVLMNTTNAKRIDLKVHGPMNDMVNVTYGFSDTKSAIMEVAQPCGIDLIQPVDRNPTIALSNGLGEMMLDAVERGANKIIVALGGSVTNDGGFGMLHALGAVFYDGQFNVLPLSFSSIIKATSVDLQAVKDKFEQCELLIASDVNNVYTGEKGATYVFGAQKGANAEQLDYLECALLHLQDLFFNHTNIDLSKVEKSGSAGGIGGALYLLGAKMLSGIQLVLNMTQLERHIETADYVISGEGSIDAQTKYGKTIAGIANITKKHNKPFIVFGGRVSEDAQNLYELGVTAMFSITNEVKSLSDALTDAHKYLKITTMNVFKLILSKRT